MKNPYFLIFICILIIACNNAEEKQNIKIEESVKVESYSVKYKRLNIDGVNLFYREAGNPNNPTIVLLHGFPTSSHQYRKVLSTLSDEYYLIAPDYPAFGESDVPDPESYEYTFDNIAHSVDRLLEQLELDSYVLMIQDYGAPIGFRIATKHPERIKGFVIQNGNAYEEGMGEEAWKGLRAMWSNRTPENEKAIADIVFSYQGLKWQYTHGTKRPELINPDNWNLDYMKMNRPGAKAMNLDLLYDYQNITISYIYCLVVKKTLIQHYVKRHFLAGCITSR